MMDLSVRQGGGDFSALHAAMQRYVDAELLPGVSSAVLRGRDLVDLHCVGWADREAEVPFAVDTICRVFSNTKLVTSCAALLLHEEGRIGLDDPVERYLPQLADRRVLRPGATDAGDTEPANGPITIRHLMTHTSGLSYGLLDPDTLIYRLYTEARVGWPNTTLAEMVDILAGLPLAAHPGTRWDYSIAIDVLARVIEVVSGERFGDLLRRRIFEPLGMVDTDFWVPADKRERFARLYEGADLMQPMLGGLAPTDSFPWPGAYLQRVPRQSGGGGLVSTLPDMLALVRALVPGDNTLLRPETLELLRANQLPAGMHIQFAGVGELPGKGHGLASAVSQAALPHEPLEVAGELWWGGIAGTQWWISPRQNLAAVVMTQRHWGFAHPFAAELKALTYAAVLG
jgi:CubicO group peptidase (beta-lactamase class C family)